MSDQLGQQNERGRQLARPILGSRARSLPVRVRFWIRGNFRVLRLHLANGPRGANGGDLRPDFNCAKKPRHEKAPSRAGGTGRGFRGSAHEDSRIAKLDLRPRQVCSLSDSLSHEPAALLPWPEFARQPALVAPGQTSRPLISLINFSACRFWTGGLTPRTLQYYSFVHGANACWR